MVYAFPIYKPVAGNDAPGRGLYRPRDTVGRIYAEDDYTLLHNNIKYRGLMVSDKKIICFSQIISLWELSAAMETKVLIRPVLKPNATVQPTQLSFDFIALGPTA